MTFSELFSLRCVYITTQGTVVVIFLLFQNNPPTIVKERVLGLIQYWADAFQGRPQLATVGDVYDELKAQGVEFPPVDLDQLAPVETHSRVSSACSGRGYM